MKKILILIGEGKSTLTDIIYQHCNHNPYILLGVKEVIKKADSIKIDSKFFTIVIHLESEDDIKKIPLGIKRRARIFKISF